MVRLMFGSRYVYHVAAESIAIPKLLWLVCLSYIHRMYQVDHPI